MNLRQNRTVSKTAQLGSTSFGRLTSSARMLPSFLISGGQRCGTTSMYRTLSQHPAVLKPVLHKGIHYFDTGYANGLAWYRGRFPLHLTAARVERATGVKAQTFESSPYYLFHPLAADRICRDLRDVRLIVLVRDPVERAYSAHSHEVGRGFETEDFPTALALEGTRLDGEADRLIADPTYYSFDHQHHGYLARGRYAEQLERLGIAVGRDRIHVVDSQRFFDTPDTEYAKVLDFLGLPELGIPVYDKHNARRRSPMSPELRESLRTYFEPYDAALVDWLGALPSWRQ